MLKRINSVPGTDYLFHGNDQKELDLGIHSLQCGRKVDSLKLWLSWNYLGDEGYEDRIDPLFSMAKYARTRAPKEPNVPGATGAFPRKKKDTKASLPQSLVSLILCLIPKMVHSLYSS